MWRAGLRGAGGAPPAVAAAREERSSAGGFRCLSGREAKPGVCGYGAVRGERQAQVRREMARWCGVYPR